MSTKELTTLFQAVTGHGLFAGHLSRWRESLPSTCKLCGEMGETSNHLWGECPALELERTQLSSMGTGGRNKTPHHLILDFFEHEKERGLMNANSEWLEESDPDDPPTQSEDGGERTPFPPPKRRRLYGPFQYNGMWTRRKPSAFCLLNTKGQFTLESFREWRSIFSCSFSAHRDLHRRREWRDGRDRGGRWGSGGGGEIELLLIKNCTAISVDTFINSY